MLVTYDEPQTRTVLRECLLKVMETRWAAGAHCEAVLFAEAVEALGYWVKWGLRPRTAPASFWSDAESKGFAKRLISLADSVCETVTARAEWMKESWDGTALLRGTKTPANSAMPIDLLRERMWADAVHEGLETIPELVSPESVGLDQAARQHESPAAVVEAQDRLLKAIHEFDRALQGRRWEICVAAQTGVLAAMRAPFPEKAPLPWWLSGTLEMMSLAASTPSSRILLEKWSSTGAAKFPAEYLYRMERITQECVYALHGKGIPVHESTEMSAPDGNVWCTYTWRYESNEGPMWIRLVAPDGQLGSRQVKLLLIEPKANNAMPRMRGSRHRRTIDLVGQELLGKMMFLNGLMFRWCSVGEGQPPKAILAERRPSQLPDAGQLILVDCQTGKVLRPATGREVR